MLAFVPHYCARHSLDLTRSAQRLPFRSLGPVPGLLTEAGDLYPHALQEAGKLCGRSEPGYRIELLERRDVKAFVRLTMC
jgi:hypothetical protein